MQGLIKRRLLPVLCAALWLTGCSKTVQWEEEVPLNTGETIWVKRSASYSYKGGNANPFDIALRPDRKHELELDWKGVRYTWEGDAGLMLLAIDPNGRPVLVANAANSSWGDQNGFKCVKPYYVQFVPDRKGTWTWPPQIEPWLYGLHANLMEGIHYAPQDMPKRVSSAHRAEFNAVVRNRYPETGSIDPNYVPDFCKGRI